MKVSCQTIADFYKLHHEKSKLFTASHFKAADNTKNFVYHHEMDESIFVNFFEYLHNSISKAKENGLDSVLKLSKTL